MSKVRVSLGQGVRACLLLRFFFMIIFVFVVIVIVVFVCLFVCLFVRFADIGFSIQRNEP